MHEIQGRRGMIRLSIELTDERRSLSRRGVSQAKNKVDRLQLCSVKRITSYILPNIVLRLAPTSHLRAKYEAILNYSADSVGGAQSAAAYLFLSACGLVLQLTAPATILTAIRLSKHLG